MIKLISGLAALSIAAACPAAADPAKPFHDLCQSPQCSAPSATVPGADNTAQKEQAGILQGWRALQQQQPGR